MSPVASIVFAIASQGFAADEAIAIEVTGEVYCDRLDAPFDPATVHSDVEASVDGAFWLPLTPEGVVARAFYSASGPSLRTGSGEELVPVVVHETSSVIVVAVPEGATAGTTYLLHPALSDEPEDALVLRVVARNLVVGDVSIAQATPIGDPSCVADCTMDGQLIPSAPAVTLTMVDEGSAIVDAWVLFGGETHSAFTPRLVDSLRVAAPPGGGAQIVQVGAQVLDAGASYTIVVEARSPVDASLLETETFVIDAHAEIPLETVYEGYVTCSSYDGDYDDGGNIACGCSGAGDPTSAIGLALFALALRRRRAR